MRNVATVALVAVVVLCGSGDVRADASTAFPKHYHTSAELVAAFHKLADSCSIMTLSESGGLMLATIQAVKAPAVRSFILFGEHPRELISPELAWYMAQQLCSNPSLPLLQRVGFQFVPLANKWGREQIEGGHPCIRCNEHGVDLNRNWGSHWAHFAKNEPSIGCTAGGGSSPFSEAETLAVKNAMLAYKPTMFLSVHSGAVGMYTPHAFDTFVPSTGVEATYERDMLDMLRQLNAAAGECPFGAAGQELQYTCTGTCLDYAFEEARVPYTFAFEVYNPNREGVLRAWRQHLRRLRFRSVRGRSVVPSQSLLEVAAVNPLEGFVPPASCFLQRRSTAGAYEDAGASVDAYLHQYNSEESFLYDGMTAEACVKYFNPVAPESIAATLKEWSSRTLHLASLVEKHHSRRR